MLCSLSSPLPIGPLSFEDSLKPTLPTHQQQSVVPPPVIQPALDEAGSTLWDVLIQVDQEMASQGVDTSSSDPRPDIEVPAPSASIHPAAGSSSPDIDAVATQIISSSSDTEIDASQFVVQPSSVASPSSSPPDA